MARLPRLSIPGFAHHVIQRGVDRQPIFVDEIDRARYLAALRAVASQSGLAVHAYVLLPNHVHLLVSPHAAGDVGRALQAVGRRYVRWFNDRHERTGGLFEGRYRAAVVEPERYLLACMRYVECNPVRATLASDPAGFRWSSHRHHVGLAVDGLVTDHPVYWALGNTPFERQAAYREFCEHGAPDEEIRAIRFATHGGWLLGSAESVPRGSPTRRPNARSPGRPRKTDSVPE